jgi:hypothetical protein
MKGNMLWKRYFYSESGESILFAQPDKEWDMFSYVPSMYGYNLFLQF